MNITKMKTVILVSIIWFIQVSDVSSQNNVRRIPQDLLAAKPLQLSEEQQINKVIQYIIQYYGRSFRFYEQLLSGNFTVEKSTKTDNQHILKIFSDNKKLGKFETIRIKQAPVRDGYSELIFERNDVERHVRFSEFENAYKKRFFTAPIQIIDKEKILFDQMILRRAGVPEDMYRIFNRTIAENFDNQNGDPATLFRLVQDAVLIPHGTDGSESKILAIDNQFHSLIYFDSNVMESDAGEFNQVYGRLGRGYGQFMNPTGIASGRWNYAPYLPIYILPTNIILELFD